jgi:hypothetical protein
VLKEGALKKAISTLSFLLLAVACRTTAPKITGPTLPLPEMTPEALGVKELPPQVLAMNSNRAWNYKPGLLLGLVNFGQAINKDMRLSEDMALKLKLITSSLNHCLY